MSTMKVHVVKGVNSYTGDLLKKQNRNINRRREVNFNVDSLTEHERSSSRAKSFAIYKPPTKFKSESTDKSKSKTNKVEFDPVVRTKDGVNEVFATKLELSDEDEFAEKYQKFDDEVEVQKGSDGARDEDSDAEADLAVPGYGFADQDAFDLEAGNDDAEDQHDNDREGGEYVEDILGGDVPSPHDNREKAESVTFEDVFNSDDREKSTDNCDREDNDEEAWGYNFSSNRDREDDASVSTASARGSANVFQKFRDKVKETYDRSGFKEMHKKNMEVLRKQFKSVLGRKKGRSRSQSSEDTGSGSSEYWESKADTNFDRADFAPKPYGFGANRSHAKVLNYESDDDAKKRCCCC
ncbi:conserved hypothetical protein [Theileria orientalis strain Shintoku]|uniref:Uncharacterized protein n=1 Tax=Theileria orientalis strain Shintoku TaxID=869250 RepID=J4C3J7_THEOR|nr:conserved hypothetical protein [Theileria orientalis strain Shintoku]PVC53347.1 hypothetical protein MACL_00000139 [Theileria orientalis]BAM40561.1 conserved hypothetical protein [Theileria orientalis strain Shintoku]|eukprot:XP_009690862.1 conserved hypothetical protein [Theileria orientalis strain Shintoku]